MPTVSVRLSEEQHEELRQEVFRRGRGWSLQKEIVGRLFGLAAGASTEKAQVAKARESLPARADDTVAPAASPRKCSREARHHINHSGKPCPECGYPKEA